MAFTPARFYAWFGEYAHGHVDLSDNQHYPSFTLPESIASESVYNDWTPHYASWTALVDRTEAEKALKGERTWLLTSPQYYDPQQMKIVYEGGVEPNGSEFMVVAVPSGDGYNEVEVHSISGEKETETGAALDAFLDYHIISISDQPIEGKDVAVFNAKGQFLHITIDNGVPEHPVWVVRYTFNPLTKDTVPKYYVQLNDWSRCVETGDPDDENDSGDFALGCWVPKLLEMIGKRVLERRA